MRVGPIAKRHRRHVQPREPAVRLVHDVDADFFLHNVTLVFQILIIHFQGAHAVRFEPQHALQRIGRHGLVIIRHIIARRAVQQASAGIDQLDVLRLRGVSGALEHHVFEQMRKPAASPRFEPESDFVVHAHGDDGCDGVRRDDYL